VRVEDLSIDDARESRSSDAACQDRRAAPEDARARSVCLVPLSLASTILV
jgi:hypothetical protein